MNIFNRIVMIILIPVTAFVVSVALFIPNEVWKWLAGFFATYQLAPEVYGSPLVRIALLAAALAIDLVLLFLFLLEIRRGPQRMVRVRRASGGEVRLPVDSIAQRIAYHVDQLSQVIQVQPRIGEKNGAVLVHLLVFTAPDVDVPAKADEIIGTVQWIVREKLGLTLAGEPRVELRVAPYPQTSAVERAKPPAGPTPA